MEQDDRDRLMRLETQFATVQEIKDMITELTRELRSGFVSLRECDGRCLRTDERVSRLEARVRDADVNYVGLRDKIEVLATKPPPAPAEPGWTKILLALVSVLGGSLITIIITMAIYYQAKP